MHEGKRYTSDALTYERLMFAFAAHARGDVVRARGWWRAAAHRMHVLYVGSRADMFTPS